MLTIVDTSSARNISHITSDSKQEKEATTETAQQENISKHKNKFVSSSLKAAMSKINPFTSRKMTNEELEKMFTL
jgi:hypothetical protein